MAFTGRVAFPERGCFTYARNCETDQESTTSPLRFLEANQHRQHPLQLPIQVNFVTGQSLKPIGVKSPPREPVHES
jgi:hypothetical protein